MRLSSPSLPPLAFARLRDCPPPNYRPRGDRNAGNKRTGIVSFFANFQLYPVKNKRARIARLLRATPLIDSYGISIYIYIYSSSRKHRVQKCINARRWCTIYEYSPSMPAYLSLLQEVINQPLTVLLFQNGDDWKQKTKRKEFDLISIISNIHTRNMSGLCSIYAAGVKWESLFGESWYKNRW